MTYHATSSTEDAESLARMALSPAISAQLHTFSFTDTHLEDVETLAVGTKIFFINISYNNNIDIKIFLSKIHGMVSQASLRMFHDLELVRVFQLDRAVLARWLLTVKKNYRPEVRRISGYY